MHPSLTKLTGALCCALFAAWPATAQEQHATDTGAVMQIDGHPISSEEFGRWLIDIEVGHMAKRFGEQWLVHGEAVRDGVAVTPEQVRKELDAEIAERVRGAFLGKREDWLDELHRLERTEGGHRAQRTVELAPLMDSIELCRKHRVVPEEKIRRDWELFYGPGGREYELRGIKCLVEVVSPEAGTPREIYEEGRRRAFAAQLSRALDIRERILDGYDFASLARDVSDDAESRERGGLLNVKFRRPGWTDEFVAELAKLKPGEISQPMYAKGGYWIMQLVSVVETPYESVRDKIEQRLVELGPEQDESGDVWNKIVAGMQVKVLPTMFAPGDPDLETREPVMGLTVNGTPVPRSEFALWLLHSRGESYLRTYAEYWLVERKAESLGITATPAEVEARTQAFVDHMCALKHEGSRETWRAYLLRTGADEEAMMHQYRQRMRVDLLAEKILMSQRKITDDDVRARWKQLYGEQGRWIEARMIQLDFVPPQLEPGLTREQVDQRMAAARESLQVAAERVRKRIDDGEDFATLARAIDSDPGLKARGGKLEGRFRPETWSPEVASAVLALTPGQVTGPFEVEHGFVIFEVLSARAVPFEEVAGELRKELETEPIPDTDLTVYRNVLFKQSKVEVLPPMYQ